VKFCIAVLLFVLSTHTATSQALLPIKDTIKILQADSLKVAPKSNYGNLLDSSSFLNVNGKPESLQVLPQNSKNNITVLFYVIAFLMLIFGLIRSFYDRYFTTLFRVFFNTTLKQNQLTDQLVQAKLPSLVFNILFVLATGFYVFALINLYKGQKVIINKNNVSQLILCISFVLVCYVVKYWGLLLLGWLADYKPEAKTYIFIIFLLNKIVGVLLLCTLPFLFFANSHTNHYVIVGSIIGVLLLLLLRYYRSFSILQGQLKINVFHFLLYIIALEVVPFAIIFKYCNAFLITKP
jgi:Domain of unknown function (DUF4271)